MTRYQIYYGAYHEEIRRRREALAYWLMLISATLTIHDTLADRMRHALIEEMAARREEW